MIKHWGKKKKKYQRTSLTNLQEPESENNEFTNKRKSTRKQPV
jgi:hypothetical protein